MTTLSSFGVGEAPATPRWMLGAGAAPAAAVQRLGFRVWGSGFGVWGLGVGLESLGFWVWILGFWVWVLGFGVWNLRCKV